MGKSIVGPFSTQPGRRRKFQGLEIYSEDGMIFIEDQRDGDFHAITCKDARARCNAFIDELAIWDAKRESGDPQERAYAIEYYRVLKGMIDNLNDTIRDAKDQGDPTNEVVRRHKLLAFLRGRRAGAANPETLPASNAVFTGGPSMPLVFGAHTQRQPGVIILPPNPNRAISVAPPDLPPGYKNPDEG